jgi:hypothetical protein
MRAFVVWTLLAASGISAIGPATRPSIPQPRGAIAPGIRYHLDLPLPSKWNGRLIGLGDGGTDGISFSTKPYIQARVGDGDAVVNSNSGHDDAVRRERLITSAKFAPTRNAPCTTVLTVDRTIRRTGFLPTGPAVRA